MLKAQKKISKKEIKEDKLVTTYFKLSKWIEENKRLTTYIIMAPIAVAVIWFLWSQRVAENNDKATAMLSKVMPYYDEGRYEEAINGIPEQGIHGLQGIVDEYGDTEAGEFAKLYLANAYFALKEYDKAIKYYEDAELKDKMLVASALAGAGACYEAKGDFLKAASFYEKAAFKNMTQIMAPEYLQKAAINYGLGGNKEKALELLKLLKKEFPNTTYAYEANIYIAEFSN